MQTPSATPPSHMHLSISSSFSLLSLTLSSSSCVPIYTILQRIYHLRTAYLPSSQLFFFLSLLLLYHDFALHPLVLSLQRDYLLYQLTFFPDLHCFSRLSSQSSSSSVLLSSFVSSSAFHHIVRLGNHVPFSLSLSLFFLYVHSRVTKSERQV